jgi:hypothetical protein
MTQDGAESLIDVLTSDHRAILALLDEASAAEATDAARERLVMELIRHFVAEEQYLYPAVAARIEDGRRISDAAFRDHRGCEHALRALEGDGDSSAPVSEVLGQVREQFSAHVRAQEGTLFSQLEAVSSPQDLVRLGDEVLGSEQLAPTRPRTVAVESAALNKVSSFVEGFIDRVRDSYSHRGVDREDD